ncbi:tektin-3 [Lingula anatina]|uniref:Tektin n=1 Tax=Lingula anatina TaxID=7574 RepID=A0A1S3HFV6_LINAN|nr:tektin-3 [Lingula anatina]|eukprot:XP_013384963.1 tektin-3 [Lingula anatina]
MAVYYASSPVVRTRSATPLTPDIGRIAPIGYSTGHKATKDVGHARTYFNPARQQLYNRFSHGDWSSSNHANYHMSDRERSFAERLRADAWRAVKETDHRTRNRQADVTKRLGERVEDIDFWKKELVNECRAMENEIENLKEHKRILEKAYMDTNNPLHIAEECLLHREKRQGIDMVHDDVERSLSKEVLIIKNCQERMRKVLQRAHAQLKLDRAALHEMEKDAKDKHHAHHLDDRMHQLRNTSMGIGYHPGIENVDNTISVPHTWVKFTQNNILRSQKERAASERLRGEIDACLRACANEMWNVFNHVNNSFNMRIRESTDARNKLQAHLNRTMQEVFDMEKNIELLRKAIHDKEAPMKVAQTRLDERCRRQNVELCNDPVMRTLQKEVNEIRESVRYLKEKLRQSEISLARLMKTKSTLEHDISVKENSLSIDSKACMGMRKGFPMDPKVGPIFNMPLAQI